MQPVCECQGPARGSCLSRTSSTSWVGGTSWNNPCEVLHVFPATQEKVRHRIPLPQGAATPEFCEEFSSMIGAENFCLVLHHISKPKKERLHSWGDLGFLGQSTCGMRLPWHCNFTHAGMVCTPGMRVMAQPAWLTSSPHCLQGYLKRRNPP